MRELSLHLLDIAENSVAAGAANIYIKVVEDLVHDHLHMDVIDDGKGMDEVTVEKVMDPFITSRTTRKVGLGIPLLKDAAEACQGFLTIQSKLNVGTTLSVEFQRSNIDRMPLGDLAGTILNLVISVPAVNWIFEYVVDREVFHFESDPIRKELGDIPFSDPMVLSFIREMLETGVSNIAPSLN